MNIILTENQLNKIKKIISEEETNNRYRRNVKVSIDYYGSSYQGKEINDITSESDMNISYVIEQEHRSWGIKDIQLYNIMGPNSISLEVEYYSDEDNTDFENIELPINWESLNVNKLSGEGVISVGDDLEIGLGNDDEGNLIIKSMSIDIYSL